jgi:hypothetical protein
MARTQAFGEFRTALDMSLELIRQERRLVKDPPPPQQQSIARGLRGGAAVLMVAAFEAYLDDMIAETVETISKHQPPVSFSKLPDAMQVHNVYQILENAMKGPKHQASGPKLQRLPAVKAASVQIARDELSPDAFGGTAGNPGKAAVIALFKRIGIHDMLDLCHARFVRKWGHPVASSFIGDKLTEIVNRRHKVAHRADALSISRVELKEAERFLRIFSEVLDIETASYMRTLCRIAR